MKTFISGDVGLSCSHLLRLLLKDETISRSVTFDNFTSARRSHLDGNMADSRLRIVEADLKDSAPSKPQWNDVKTISHRAENPDIARADTARDRFLKRHLFDPPCARDYARNRSGQQSL